MTLPEFALLLVGICLSALGQFLLKLGAEKLGAVNVHNAVKLVLTITYTPELIFGLVSYAVGAIFYILLLTRVDLSIAAPSASIMYVFSVLLGYFFFKETITMTHGLGLGLIVCGVLLVASQ